MFLCIAYEKLGFYSSSGKKERIFERSRIWIFMRRNPVFGALACSARTVSTKLYRSKGFEPSCKLSVPICYSPSAKHMCHGRELSAISSFRHYLAFNQTFCFPQICAEASHAVKPEALPGVAPWRLATLVAVVDP